MGSHTSPRIRSLEPVSGDPERVRVELDDGTALEPPRALVVELGLGSGDPVDPQLRARLADGTLRWQAREAALRLLAHRPRSRNELAGRLGRRDLPGHVIRACLDRLEDQGLVDDPAFARAWVRDRLRLKPRGRNALLSELRRKGVAAAVAREAVDEVFRDEEVQDAGLAVEAALAWLRRQGPRIRTALREPPFSDAREKARRRLLGYLARRGFRGGDAVQGMEAVDRVVQDTGDAEG